MKMKFKPQYVASFSASIILLYLLLIIPQAVFAADLSWTADGSVSINSNTYTIVSGSEATTLTVDATTLTVTVPSGSAFTIQSSDRYLLANNQNVSQQCSASTNQLALTGPVTAIVTPDATATCAVSNASTGGSGGGGPFTDTTPPTNTSISIAAGANEVKVTSVILTLAATGATEMLVSNNSDFTGAVWETYLTSKNWNLTSGDGTKTVYAKFRDAALNVSTAVSDTIKLVGAVADAKKPADAEKPAEIKKPTETTKKPDEKVTPAEGRQATGVEKSVDEVKKELNTLKVLLNKDKKTRNKPVSASTNATFGLLVANMNANLEKANVPTVLKEDLVAKPNDVLILAKRLESLEKAQATLARAEEKVENPEAVVTAAEDALRDKLEAFFEDGKLVKKEVREAKKLLKSAKIKVKGGISVKNQERIFSSVESGLAKQHAAKVKAEAKKAPKELKKAQKTVAKLQKDIQSRLNRLNK